MCVCERGDTHPVRIQPLFWWICTAWLPLRSHIDLKSAASFTVARIAIKNKESGPVLASFKHFICLK